MAGGGRERDREKVIGRYALHAELASGGMARVHLGRLLGPVGFARIVAIKRLHPMFASDPEFVAMFLDEARVAARIIHPNVVPILDVVALKGELFLVLEYVRGEALSRLLATAANRETAVPPDVIATVMIGVLDGLHAAHEARSERGEPLGIVHRDVSPANVLVGSDGIPRVLDFGVAKAAGRLQTTRDGQLKGKVAYMAPEQAGDGVVDRRTDIWAAAVLLWELVALQRLFQADNPVAMIRHILEDKIVPPSFGEHASTTAFDAIALRGLERDPSARFQTAREMAIAIEETMTPATARSVGAWVEASAGDALRARTKLVEELERSVNVGRGGVRETPSMTLNSRLAAAFGDDAAPKGELAALPKGHSVTTPIAQPAPPTGATPMNAIRASHPAFQETMPLGSSPGFPMPPPGFTIASSGGVTTEPEETPRGTRLLQRAMIGFAAGFLIVVAMAILHRRNTFGTLTSPRFSEPAATQAPAPPVPVPMPAISTTAEPVVSATRITPVLPSASVRPRTAR